MLLVMEGGSPGATRGLGFPLTGGDIFNHQLEEDCVPYMTFVNYPMYLRVISLMYTPIHL